MAPRNLIIFTLVVIILIAGGLLINNLGGSSPYYYTVGEVLSEDFSVERNFRVAGLLDFDSVQQQGDELSFQVMDSAREKSLPVVYQGTKPEGFGEQSELIVEGSYQQEHLQAEKILLQCPSQYREKLEEE